MPDRQRHGRGRGQDAVPERIERLNSAVDRVAAGQPAPMLDDPELDELLGVALRLRAELPRDLPDPVFRAQLKEQLTGPHPYLRAVPRHRLERYPYIAAIGALTAILLAAITVGSLVIWNDPDDEDDAANVVTFPSIDTVGTVGSKTGTAVVVIATTAVSDQQRTAAVTPTEGSTEAVTLQTATTPQPTPTEDDLPQPTATVAVTPTTPSQQQTPTPQPTAQATATTSTEPTATQPVFALGPDLPEVEKDTVEVGPIPAVSPPGGDPPQSEIAFSLDLELPNLGDSAPVYFLAPPATDPAELVTRAAATLGFEGEVQVAPDVSGRHDQYVLFSANSGAFLYTPDTGAFTFGADSSILPPPEEDAEIDADTAIQASKDWLESIGYPVERLSGDARANQFDETQWIVYMTLDELPTTAVGHHVGVTIWVDNAGRVTSGSGFWLNFVSTEEAPLLSASEAWDMVKQREGLWTGGGVADAGGEYDVDTIDLGYILTGDGAGGLILQPVLRCEGEFTTIDGSSARIEVYVKAARGE